MKSAAALCALTLSVYTAVATAAYPDHPVRLIVGFSAGGPTDVVARAFAEHAAASLGHPFIVENRPGANTILAAEAVASAKPDGYTLLLGATNHTMIPALYKDRIKFDALNSFKPICTLAISPTLLVVGPSMPVDSLGAFLDTVKKEPGARTYATPGTGSSGHFASEQFLRRTGASMNHIPYKGAAQAVTDLMGGQVDSSLATLGSVLPQIQAGKLTALAIAAPARSALLPDVPTFAEAGVKDYRADAWYGLLAPAGTPDDVVQALMRAATSFSRSDSANAALRALGMEPQNMCKAEFAGQLAREINANGELARELNLQAN
ncbi:Bug family tripartite tricarboxylate transporter substrate binding protein [Bordetella petrii]|uniref:Bug family tripartite tricarboxylate transporter substrate binding protein n=1 Tax=Bordetella petrii TaxID=94624 RepID=UPI003734A4BB